MSPLEFLKLLATLAVTVAILFWLLTLPIQLCGRRHTHPDPKRARRYFWLLMLARCVIVVFMIFILLSESSKNPSSIYGPKPDSTKGAALVTIVIVAADALWDILRRWIRSCH